MSEVNYAKYIAKQGLSAVEFAALVYGIDPVDIPTGYTRGEYRQTMSYIARVGGTFKDYYDVIETWRFIGSNSPPMYTWLNLMVEKSYPAWDALSNSLITLLREKLNEDARIKGDAYLACFPYLVDKLDIEIATGGEEKHLGLKKEATLNRQIYALAYTLAQKIGQINKNTDEIVSVRELVRGVIDNFSDVDGSGSGLSNSTLSASISAGKAELDKKKG
jgi:hypothetical protein